MRNIVQATDADREEILRLYKAQLGREFCPWDDEYPSYDTIEFDMSRDALFVMKDEDGRIIAAISLDQDENVDALEFWTKELLPGGELSRLAVAPDMQNQGIARQMIEFATAEWARRGMKSIHYMVNSLNTKALRSYAHLEFTKVGEVEMYDEPFWCYEKKI